MLSVNLLVNRQAYFWTKRWQEGEKEADEDIKAGRVKVFESAEELFKDLD
jgi:antitoxin MazE